MFEESAAVQDLFASKPTKIKPRSLEVVSNEVLAAPPRTKRPYEDKNLSIAQIKDREERTLFVGNVELNTKRKHLKHYFSKYGEIEKVWVRSVPVESSKIPKKGLVALKKFAEHADTMNAYVLFKNKEDTLKARDANNSEFRGKHIRVSLANQKELDVKTTIFVGNLNFAAKEEDLRTHFSKAGKISLVRIIRDKETHRGKGIAYIKFETKEGFLAGLKLNKSTYMDRELRIKKAISVEQEKKMRFRREQAAAHRRKMNARAHTSDSEIKMSVLKKFSENGELEDTMTATKINAIFTHQGVVPQTMVGKKIKKLKKKGYSKEKELRMIHKIKDQAHKKLERDVLAKGDMMAQRKVKRKKQVERNIKKAKAFKNKEPSLKKVSIS